MLTVGYLTAIKGDLKDKQGLAISGALKMAIDQVIYKYRCIYVECVLYTSIHK